MLIFYKLGLLVMVLSEYGFQSRARAQSRFGTFWRPPRTAIRLAIWVAIWLLAGRPMNRCALIFLAAGILLAEIGALLLRWRIRRAEQKGDAYGSPLLHLIPPVYAVIYPLAAIGMGRLAGASIILEISEGALNLALGLTMLWCWSTLLTVSVVNSARPGQAPTASGLPKEAGQAPATSPSAPDPSDRPGKRPGKPRSERGDIGAGEVIGILERLLTYVLVLTGGLTAVGFVIAAKAAARFPLFKEKAFAEYFLIGTLTSVGMALLAGLLLRVGPALP